MEAEPDFVFSICGLDKTDFFSDEKLGEEVMVTLELEFAVVPDRSDLDLVIVLRFTEFFRKPPG